MSGYLRLSDGKVVPVANGLVIGRIAGCDIVIDDGKASRRHARIVVEGSVVEVEDLDSSNGTQLNGKPVTRRLLRGGDVITIGKTELAYHEGPVPGAAAPAAAKPVFDAEDDLFGGGEAPVAAPPAPAAAAAAAPPPPAPLPPPPPPRPAAAPPPAAPRAVVEFEDEVVEVRRAPEPAAKANLAPSGSAGREPEVKTQSRILQYHKTSGGGGVLGDDLAQMSGGTRSLVYALVLLAAAGVVYGIIHLVR